MRFHRRFPLITALVLMPWACGKQGDSGQEEPGNVSAVLMNSLFISSAAAQLTNTVSLSNVTGLADSLGLNLRVGGYDCGFEVWSANSQGGRSGLEGRTYETFNLGDPTDWDSKGGGLKGSCETAVVSQVEAYFVYMDLHLTLPGGTKVVRAYMGQQPPFEAGDLVLNKGGVLSWFDLTRETLVSESSGRPEDPRRFTLPKEIPWFDNNGTQKIIMMEFRVNTDMSQTYTVTKETSKVVIDIDFTNSGVAVSEPDSDEGLMRTISVPFLEASNTSAALLSAKLTVLKEEEKGSEADPEPEIGN